ncbi:CDP-alcohol phosphatidyltransferase family protein [Paenibacillus protaetiae]|uniref:CDP-diacylglycerol--glycerol-3-phosphate 3-phosphatidyltransferase n=1 Tax=Paenibacillus protaetiae TaxID=2509456 RepID=A0A4V0YFH5_9BACL|nr:CDP-alcohol phosphatidyltransferase family protein [Paenibacillus protaetiae]QAY67731.1 CDP-diacylglycerol--glycerol-3-phosphate 3-phosphatidyltransferase [Paenibacillus protaetiae]
MNLPNTLTAFRFVLIPVYIAVFVSIEYKMAAFFVLIAAGITDMLDGYIARKTGQVTYVGTMLDPLADKLMIITVFLSLLLSGMISWLSAAALFFRDVVMILGGLYFHFTGRKNVPANWMGKLTTVLLYAAIMFVFLEVSFASEFLWVIIAFSFVTTIVYGVLSIISSNKQREQKV